MLGGSQNVQRECWEKKELVLASLAAGCRDNMSV